MADYPSDAEAKECQSSNDVVSEKDSGQRSKSWPTFFSKHNEPLPTPCRSSSNGQFQYWKRGSSVSSRDERGTGIHLDYRSISSSRNAPTTPTSNTSTHRECSHSCPGKGIFSLEECQEQQQQWRKCPKGRKCEEIGTGAGASSFVKGSTAAAAASRATGGGNCKQR